MLPPSHRPKIDDLQWLEQQTPAKGEGCYCGYFPTRKLWFVEVDSFFGEHHTFAGALAACRANKEAGRKKRPLYEQNV